MTVIEVFADVLCPFTHAGLRNLVRERADRGRTDVALHIRSWPLELVNGEPLDPGFVAAEIAGLRASVAPDLFAGFDPSRFPATSVPAMALAATANAQSLELGERLGLALRDAVFEQGRDVADPAVLAEVAASVGLDGSSSGDPADVDRDWKEGRDRGVVGSPYFFIGGQGWFCPSLDITHTDGRFDVRWSGEDHERFLAACFD